MKRLIKKFLKKNIPFLYKLSKGLRLLFVEDSYLNETGFMQTLVSEKVIDIDGKSIPWMNYNVIDFLKERLTKDMLLFEYGCGASTMFYCNYVKSVVSVENNKEWFDYVFKELPQNGELLYEKYDVKTDLRFNYINSVHKRSIAWNVVIVDGRDRVESIKSAYKALAEDGIILLDDSSREKYQDGFKYLHQKGFKHITFCGLKPTGFSKDCTTIFYRTNNCFNI